MVTAVGIDVFINECNNQKAGEKMEVLEEMNNGEIIQKGLEDFSKVQQHMLLAKEESATKTYASLKKQYLSLKVLLNSLDVNFSDIDEIKE